MQTWAVVQHEQVERQGLCPAAQLSGSHRPRTQDSQSPQVIGQEPGSQA